MNSFQETLDYLYGLEHFGISLGLENIVELCAAGANPQDSLRIVHVAGSNGKGSSIAFLRELLRRHGLSVGVYSSPHLRHFSERITIDDSPISEAEIVALTRELRPVAEKIPRIVTFFDFTTCMALLYFARRRPDIVLLETGLGGRLDATNVARKPLLTMITNIAIEHEEFLGSTLLAVAAEKAGILKPGVPLVSGVKNEKIRDFLAGRQRELGAFASFLGRDFRVRRHGDGSFSYYGSEHNFTGLETAMRGRHQQDNAALALRAFECLAHEGLFELDPLKVAAALREVSWPGRLQQVESRPDIYLDGAHNPHGIRALVPELRRLKGERRLILLLGVMKDKRIREMTAHLGPLADEVIVTRAQLDRSCNPQSLALEMQKYCSQVMITESVSAAFALARHRAQAADLILLTGSLYCVGEAFEVLDLPVNRPAA
ncbi:MAG: bifunctional folylpolyglutamate synthase/dihydrofolate synthase [Deltaproteobacteria bacterium]|nr:bifunctional folylpolyglutamate synthase/dihydrofolate synthase [Deltaproteobacteria bacterium]